MIVLKFFNVSSWQTVIKLRNVFHTIINARAQQGKHTEDEDKEVAIRPFVKTTKEL